MPVSAAITFRMTMGSGYVAVIRGMPVTPYAGDGVSRSRIVVVQGTPNT